MQEPFDENPTLRKTLGEIVLYVTVAVVSVITIFPIYWMLVSTFQPNEYTLHYPPPLISSRNHLYSICDSYLTITLSRHG